jgi:hypothetical protein
MNVPMWATWVIIVAFLWELILHVRLQSAWGEMCHRLELPYAASVDEVLSKLEYMRRMERYSQQRVDDLRELLDRSYSRWHKNCR